MNSGLVPIAAALCAATLLSGCVAAVVPVAAAGLIARRQLKLPSERLERRPRAPLPGTAKVELLPTTTLPAPAAAPPSRFDDFAAFAIDQHKRGLAGEKRDSVIMAPDSTLSAPTVVPCDARPSAVMIDADLQSGGRPLATALARLRNEGLKVLWTLDDGDDAAIAPAALAQAGFVEGDGVLAAKGKAQRKQLVRQLATIDHCIVAIAGARRGDMDELYDYLRDKRTPVPSDILWNQGWFLIPPASPAATKGTP